MTEEDKLNLIIDQHREEVRHHEDCIGNIFNWTLTILLAVIGSFVALASSDAWKIHANWHPGIQVGVSVLLISQSIMSIVACRTRTAAINENARVVAKASMSLGLFYLKHEGKEFYPEKWKQWGDLNYRTTKTFPGYNVFVLNVVAIAGIVLSFFLT